MTPSEQTRFDKLYQAHRRALKLQGLSKSTIDAYARAVRGLANVNYSVRSVTIILIGLVVATLLWRRPPV